MTALRWGRAVIPTVLLLVLVGCTPSTSPSHDPSSSSVTQSPSDRLDQVRATVEGLTRTALAHDHDAFVALTNERDPSFADRVRLLYHNLSTLPLTALRIRVDPGERPVSASRQQVLGAQAWVQQATITWRLTGDHADAEHQVWLTFVVDQGAVRLAGTIDAPAAAARVPQPLWWLEPTSATVRDRITVLTGSGADQALMVGVSTQGAARVRDRLPANLLRRWDGQAVVEVPASATDFEAVLGRAPGSYASIAAVTVPEGPADTDAVRVVVNPRAAGLPAADLRETLTHELVHRATDAPATPAPVWAEEGLAEWVALRGAGRRSAGTADLLSRVRTDGAPTGLPADGDFDAGSADLARSYAEAWLACRYVADTYSVEQLGRLYARLAAGDDLDRASGDTLGVSAADLTAGWRRSLVRQAGG